VRSVISAIRPASSVSGTAGVYTDKRALYADAPSMRML
jgi:hypothetical protein